MPSIRLCVLVIINRVNLFLQLINEEVHVLRNEPIFYVHPVFMRRHYFQRHFRNQNITAVETTGVQYFVSKQWPAFI